jgi:diketogulonate reductase-like aldo/keto reductase
MRALLCQPLHTTEQHCRLRAIGVSNFEERHLEELVSVGRIKAAVNQVLKQGTAIHLPAAVVGSPAQSLQVTVGLQVECHPRLPQNELRAACQRLDIVMTAYSPFGAEGADNAGLLTGSCSGTRRT